MGDNKFMGKNHYRLKSTDSFTKMELIKLLKRKLELFSKYNKVLCLSAIPIQMKPKDIYSQLQTRNRSTFNIQHQLFIKHLPKELISQKSIWKTTFEVWTKVPQAVKIDMKDNIVRNAVSRALQDDPTWLIPSKIHD